MRHTSLKVSFHYPIKILQGVKWAAAFAVQAVVKDQLKVEEL